MRTPLKVGLLVSLSAGLTALVSLGAYRFYQYQHLLNAVPQTYVTLERSIYDYDDRSGYRYRPDTSVTAQWRGKDDHTYQISRIAINHHGHRSQNQETTDKDVFRIAVLGDSLSACIHNNISWADILEKNLNDDKALLSRLHKKRFEVINYSRDGIGLVQFPAIFESEIRSSSFDLLTVHFITADIFRQFIWRKTVEVDSVSVVLNCTRLPAIIESPYCTFAGVIVVPSSTNEGQLPALRKRLAEIQAKKFRWLSWNPLPPTGTELDDRDEALRLGSEALRKIASIPEPVLFLHLPVYWELVYRAVPAITGELMRKVPEIPITPMIEYFPVAETFDINRWVNFPNDMHFSDAGAQIYAHAVHQRLVKYFAPRN